MTPSRRVILPPAGTLPTFDFYDADNKKTKTTIKVVLFSCGDGGNRTPVWGGIFSFSTGVDRLGCLKYDTWDEQNISHSILNYFSKPWPGTTVFSLAVLRSGLFELNKRRAERPYARSLTRERRQEQRGIKPSLLQNCFWQFLVCRFLTRSRHLGTHTKEKTRHLSRSSPYCS